MHIAGLESLSSSTYSAETAEPRLRTHEISILISTTECSCDRLMGVLQIRHNCQNQFVPQHDASVPFVIMPLGKL